MEVESLRAQLEAERLEKERIARQVQTAVPHGAACLIPLSVIEQVISTLFASDLFIFHKQNLREAFTPGYWKFL